MHSLWIEKYRPKKFSEIKGQSKIIDRVKAMVKLKNLSHLLLAGPPGCGKTTLALVAAMELFGENWKDNTLETNASDDRGINIVRQQIKDFARTRPMGNAPFKICILDEADALTKEAQHALRRTMETYSDVCRFALVVNYPSKIIDPIQSRCTIFRFKPLEKKDIESIINNIAKHEKIKVDKSTVESLYQLSEGDVRRVQNILQSSAAISNNINEKIIYEIVSAARPKEILDILNITLKGDFIKAREKLMEVMLQHSLSGLDVIKQIQKEIWNLNIDNNKKVSLIEKCGEVEFRMVEGSDEYLQLESLLASFVSKK